jgi:formylglycine-generating enzyme required for sulfatase activity
MVRIPAGSNTGVDPDHGPYSLMVQEFLMDRYEVTKALWDEVGTWAATNGYTDLAAGDGRAPDHPVQNVSWMDSVKWCNARSQMEGRRPVYHTDFAFTNVYRTGYARSLFEVAPSDGYRLPSVVQWEYAARGGKVGCRYPWGDVIDHDRANYFATRSPSGKGADGGYPGGDKRYAGRWPEPYTSPVGSFPPDAFGLHDMTGNVNEWCGSKLDPMHSFREIRGGCWRYDALSCGIAKVNGAYPNYGYNSTGFRTIRLADGQRPHAAGASSR